MSYSAQYLQGGHEKVQSSGLGVLHCRSWQQLELERELAASMLSMQVALAQIQRIQRVVTALSP